MKLDFRPQALTNDKAGEKHGLLTVAQYIGHDNNRKSNWLCNCACGNTVIVQDLSKSKSCGCQRRLLGKDNKRWEGYGEISGYLYSKIRRDAVRRGLLFNVNIEDLWKLFVKQKGKCALTGLNIRFAPTSTSKNDVITRTASLDRIDNSLGYVLSNLRWVHKKVNIMRGDLNDDAFFNFVAAVAKHKGLV